MAMELFGYENPMTFLPFSSNNKGERDRNGFNNRKSRFDSLL